MEVIPCTPKKKETVSLLAYLIVSNKQIHSFQIIALNELLDWIGINIDDTDILQILSGRIDNSYIDDAIKCFSGETLEVQKTLIYMMLSVAFSDNSFDYEENELIRLVFSNTIVGENEISELQFAAEAFSRKIIESNNLLFSRQKQVEKFPWYKRIIYYIIQFFKSLFSIDDKSIIQKKNNEYKESIQECARIAKEDYDVLKPSYDVVIESGDEAIRKIIAYKNSICRGTEIEEQAAIIVEQYLGTLQDEIRSRIKSDKSSLAQKERTISDFTVSLLGRTKAGKSTLHTILTGQGKEMIGSGSQRTTRFNRVFQWNMLRIIDTPGFGSAEADGRTDEEIARSVLGESDIICLIIADDSIQKDILDLIDMVASLNKPIIILLNHKENIRPRESDVKYRRFIEKPTAWLDDGERGIEGHISRIKRYAKEKGIDDLISIFPVYLLAALMSQEEEYAEHSDLLWDNSNVELFINELTHWITDAGIIKRSQTIIDETIFRFIEIKQNLIDANNEYMVQINGLRNQSSRILQKIESLKEETLKSLRGILEERFERLATQEAYTFAEEHFDDRNIEKEWKAYIEKIGLEQDINLAINTCMCDFATMVTDIIGESIEDYYYSLNNSFNLTEIAIPIQIDLKNIVRFSGSILSALSAIALIVFESNPIGWVLTGIGAALAFFSSFIDTKEVKEQKAINRIDQKLRETVKKESEFQVSEIVTAINIEITRKTEVIDMSLNQLMNTMQLVVSNVNKVLDIYDIQINKLNNWYARRIINYILNKRAEDAYQTDEIIRVDRMNNHDMIIYTSTIETLDTQKLYGIIADNIIITKGVTHEQ